MNLLFYYQFIHRLFNKMKKYLSLLFLILFLSFFKSSTAQIYNRVEANVSIKTKYETGKGTLEMGKIYFDKKNKKLVYDFAFPERQTIALFDTTMYIVKDGNLLGKQKIGQLLESTLFNIILEGQLQNYGLRNSLVYKVTKVEKDRDLVISTWSFTGKNKVLGNVLVSNKGKDLYGVIFYSPKGEIMSKQQFSNYIVVSGLRFPTEITQVIYKDKKQVIQVTTFKNIVLNSIQNANFYNFVLPRK